jgi:mRNA interferase MazF
VPVDDILAGVDDELVVMVPGSPRAASVLRPQLSRSEGVESNCVAICRGMRAVARTRLGSLEPQTMHRIERALAVILGIGERR